MKMLFRTFVLNCLLVMAAVQSPAAPSPTPGEMVMVGMWHGDEAVAEDGETWLALIKTASGFILDDVTVTVAIVEDEIVDIPPAKTGKKISVRDGRTPLAMFRNLARLAPGPVESVDVGKINLRADRFNRIVYDGQPHEIGFACREELSGEEYADCPLQLRRDAERQALQSYPIYHPCTEEQRIASEATPMVIWAGDLDRDGRLDLLIDLTTHYNLSSPTLLLSSLAKEGRLLGTAAVFSTSGC